jgi:hypothetical protein
MLAVPHDDADSDRSFAISVKIETDSQGKIKVRPELRSERPKDNEEEQVDYGRVFVHILEKVRSKYKT